VPRVSPGSASRAAVAGAAAAAAAEEAAGAKLAVEEEESEQVVAAVAVPVRRAAVGRAAVGRAACWVRTFSIAGLHLCVSTLVAMRDGWSAPLPLPACYAPAYYDQAFYGCTLPGQSRVPGAAAVARGTARAAPQRAKVRAGTPRARRRVRAACLKRPHGSATRLLGAGPAGRGRGGSALRPLKSGSRAAREPSERGRATRTSLSARDVNPAAIFNLRLYDGRLEALLDEVAHAGAAPVAASVKREIVRQHLQLQVFEAVPT